MTTQTSQLNPRTPFRLGDYVTGPELQKWTGASNFWGFAALFTTWGIIAGAFFLAAHFQTAPAILLAMALLGGRQLALAILMHDASHYSLFKTKWLNDVIGNWLCALPSLHHLHLYRKHHLKHHAYSGTDKDPDLDLVAPFPCSRQSLLRKFLRDLSGITGLKRLYGVLLMDLGFIEFTVSSKVVPIPQKGRSPLDLLHFAISHLGKKLLVQALLFIALASTGNAWLYSLWVGGYLIFFSLFVRVRSIAEHACLGLNPDPIASTRTTYANWIARLSVAPHRVNYHLEHHIAMMVPHFKLPAFHLELLKKGAYKNATIAPNYRSVLTTASSLRSLS